MSCVARRTSSATRFTAMTDTAPLREEEESVVGAQREMVGRVPWLKTLLTTVRFEIHYAVNSESNARLAEKRKLQLSPITQRH